MFGIFDILDQILPCGDSSKNDILSLENLSARKIIENGNDILKILKYIPDSVFDTLLKSAICKSYLDFISIDNPSIRNSRQFFKHLRKRKFEFPDTLGFLILNWPHEELVLRDKMPALQPPIEIFQNCYEELATPKYCISQGENMQSVFEIFCDRLVQFIMQTVFKCTPRNTHGFSCNLRRLELSGLVYSYSNRIALEGILTGIRNSSINTFGHKIEIFSEMVKYEDMKLDDCFHIIRKIIEESLNPTLGIAVYFNKVFAHLEGIFPSDFYYILSLGRCQYIHLFGFCIDANFAKKLGTYLPELVGINFTYPTPFNIESFDFLGKLEYLEEFGLRWNFPNGLIDSICNMSKGLKYLDISKCSLCSRDLECLANSIHSGTLLELDIQKNRIANDSETVGLITLCQKLKNVKVLTLDYLSLEIMRSNSITKFANALKNCNQLEFLSMRENPISVEKTNIIIEGLALKQSLRYLSLNLPGDKFPLCKKYHETINKFRNSPIYISWYLTMY